MKSSQLLLLSFLLLSSLPNLLMADNPEPLYDISGDKVLPGKNYFIVSAIWGAGGGGLSLIPGKNEICLRDVVQLSSDLQRGLSLYFQPLNGTATDYIYESTDLNIVFTTFSEVKLCTAPRVWKVDDFDPSTEQWFITTTGDIRKPGPLTSLNWFKVEKHSVLDRVYKINHCPASEGLCKDVGIYYTEGTRRLALSETPFIFVIIKAESVLNRAKIANVI
ncbi:kunitz trypsin inhibitor 5-like [Diospyros lotus]|uniref:kunitz trypsin inhibitor 5-like n=1 Tax=Diospyros lotus TaxID=55363 RepID=UPI002250A6A1|nr:kunitz trypsin inhibitor 5-like [Diospyros lotus]